MYCSFYGITEKPFSITPDPKFLYLGKTHKEAFAHLLYGIRERGGFIVVTGEIGAGKTTLCRGLLSHLDEDTLVAFIFNPTLSALELLKSINEDFGIPSKGTTKKELIDELNQFLLDKRKEGKNTVLIIDESQSLDGEVLEQVRLLSNLETETEKLLQIILIGQPEFRHILEQPRLLQLNQRVTVRYHLKALSQEETAEYIHHRLSVIDGTDKVFFTPEALKKIWRSTRGVPRLINVLCDRALLAGYGKKKKHIDGQIIDQARKEVTGRSAWAGSSNFFRTVRSGLVPASLLGIFLVLLVIGLRDYLGEGRRGGGRQALPGACRDLGRGPCPVFDRPGFLPPFRSALGRPCAGIESHGRCGGSCPCFLESRCGLALTRIFPEGSGRHGTDRRQRRNSTGHASWPRGRGVPPGRIVGRSRGSGECRGRDGRAGLSRFLFQDTPGDERRGLSRCCAKVGFRGFQRGRETALRCRPGPVQGGQGPGIPMSSFSGEHQSRPRSGSSRLAGIEAGRDHDEALRGPARLRRGLRKDCPPPAGRFLSRTSGRAGVLVVRNRLRALEGCMGREDGIWQRE